MNMDFYKRVAVVCNTIPYGKVVTYGQIALLCGKPRNARQVGYALNHKLEGEEVPAFRVVNQKGYLSGAAAFETMDMQRVLLEGEGVEVNEENCIDLKKYGWKNTLDDALALLAYFKENDI